MSALRAALTLLGVVPVGTGLGSVLFGSGVIPGPDPSPSVESELRFYAAWWIGGGLLLLWIAQRPAERGTALRALCAVLFLGGLARLLAAAQAGWPRPLFVVLMAIELVLAPVLVGWHARVVGPRRSVPINQGMGVREEPSAASFLTLEPNTRVVDRFGLLVGRVERVLVAGDYFDGIIVATEAGRRFVDAPEVRTIFDTMVVLDSCKHDVEHPGEPSVLGAPSARWGRQGVIPEDREAVIAALKQAYVHDLVGTDELAHAVGQAHTLETLDALEALVPAALKAPASEPG